MGLCSSHSRVGAWDQPGHGSRQMRQHRRQSSNPKLFLDDQLDVDAFDTDYDHIQYSDLQIGPLIGLF